MAHGREKNEILAEMMGKPSEKMGLDQPRYIGYGEMDEQHSEWRKLSLWSKAWKSIIRVVRDLA